MLASYLTRLTLTGAGNVLRPKAKPLDPVRFALRIWPTDLDVYGHLNNGRYLTLMDMGRYAHGLRTGMIPMMWRHRWWPMLGAASVEFARELRVFQRCELSTQVLAWDAKWFFMEHRLEREGQLHARAFVRLVLKQRGKTVAPAALLREMGLHHPSPPPSDSLARFMEQAAARVGS